MDFTKNVFSKILNKFKHSRVDNHSNAMQKDVLENQSSQSEVEDFEEFIDFENIIKTELEFIDNLNIPNKTEDIIDSSNCNYAVNKSDSNEIDIVNNIDKKMISESINSNSAPKTPDVDCSKTLIDKNILNEEINLNKISIEDDCIDATKDINESYAVLKTEIEFTDSTDNESVASDSILMGVHLDEEYYLDTKNGSDNIKDSEDSKPIDNSKTEMENTFIEIDISESCSAPPTMNKESYLVVEPDNIDNDDKNVPNSEMLVSLEEFDRILQRYNNDKEKDTHWDPNDYKNFDKNVIEPLSIEEINEFISNLNETQFITKPNDVIEIDTPRAFEKNEQYSQPIKPNQFNEDLKDDVISISSDEQIELQINLYDDNNIDTISLTYSDSDCSGYHSSDFEFISETEAKLDGFIINFVAPKVDKPVSRFERPNIIRSCKKELPGPSNLFNGGNSQNDIREAPQVYEIPEGDNYINLFQGIYDPVLPNSAIFFLENKSVRVRAMHVEFEGLGFDRQMAERRRLDDSDDEFKEEAQESIKKILSMYPGENRKRRRRF